MFTYKYNFANEGVISTHKNVFAYILCISVVDHADVTVDEIINLASEFAGDNPEQYGGSSTRSSRLGRNSDHMILILFLKLPRTVNGAKLLLGPEEPNRGPKMPSI